VLDPDSAGGAAIIDLLARVKDVEDSDGEWGTECLQQLYAWLTDVGIDPEGTFDDALRAMRASAESHGAMRLPGFVVRVASGQPDAAAVLTTALTVLARQLGDDATAALATRDGDVPARVRPARQSGPHRRGNLTQVVAGPPPAVTGSRPAAPRGPWRVDRPEVSTPCPGPQRPRSPGRIRRG
jgi:hypothetical protein